MGKPVSDLTDQRFGKLVVLHRDGSRRGRAAWSCRCDCGNVVQRVGFDLTHGSAPSCGCEIKTKPIKYTGGRAKIENAAMYNRWSNMRRRCNDPKQRQYHDYGGRGIKVCPEWDASFQAFMDYMGEPPTPDHTMDRIDNDKGYEPGNVKWSTYVEQAANKRPTSLRGERNAKAKLTEDQVREIRASDRKPSHLAREYGISLPAMIAVIKRLTWKHVS